MVELQKGVLNVSSELQKLEAEEQNMAKWIKYFLHEMQMIKADIEEMKERQEVLAQSVIKLYGDKDAPETTDTDKPKK